MTETSGHSYTLFETAFGVCALAWNDAGLSCLRLPELSASLTRAALRARQPQAQDQSLDRPAFVAHAVAAVQAHLSGQMHDLRELPLDLSAASDFERAVYRATRALDPGQTCTYGEMAQALGHPKAMRAVGQALGHNPWPLIIPCHRVVAAGRRLGGFSAPGGSDTKRKLLLLEAGMRRREGQLF